MGGGRIKLFIRYVIWERVILFQEYLLVFVCYYKKLKSSHKTIHLTIFVHLTLFVHLTIFTILYLFVLSKKGTPIKKWFKFEVRVWGRHFLWINLEDYFCDQTMLFLFVLSDAEWNHSRQRRKHFTQICATVNSL